MSVVVAIRKDGVVYLGADTATTSAIKTRTYSRGPLAKLMSFDNGVVVGSTGDAFVKQLLKAHPELLEWGEEGLTRRWLVMEFIPRFRELCKQMSRVSEDNVLDVDLFIAYGGILYAVICGQIFLVEDCISMGSGAYYAHGTLADEGLSVEDRLLGAMRAAAQYDEAVEMPYVLMNTQDLEYREVEE